MLKEFQLDPIRGYITHVDLQEVRLDQPIHATVSVTLVGEAVGAKEGGILTQVTNSVNIEALPLEVPEHLEVDVTHLAIGDSARLSEVTLPAGVTLLDDPESIVLATVTQPRAEEEPETTAAEGEEGAEAAEGAEEAAADGDSGGDSAAEATEE